MAQLDMQLYAAQVLELVRMSGIGGRSSTHPSNLGRLWKSHTWLLKHGLCGGNGLSGIVSKELLLQGQREAAKQESGRSP